MKIYEYGKWVLMGPRFGHRVRTNHHLVEMIPAQKLTPQNICNSARATGPSRWIIEYWDNGINVPWNIVPGDIKVKLIKASEIEYKTRDD